MEDKYPCMFEILVDDADGLHRYHELTVLRQHAEDAANDQLYPDARPCRFIELVDQVFIGKRVHLEDHGGRLLFARRPGLAVDHPDELAPQAGRAGDQHFAGLQRAGALLPVLEIVEYPVHVGHDMPVGGEQTVIAVDPGGLLIEIAGADEPVVYGEIIDPFLDQANFRMYFNVRNPDQHPDAFILQPFLPFQVGFLVETGAELEHHRHVFAVSDGVDQRIDDLAVGRQPVAGDLDGGDIGIDGGLPQHI